VVQTTPVIETSTAWAPVLDQHGLGSLLHPARISAAWIRWLWHFQPITSV